MSSSLTSTTNSSLSFGEWQPIETAPKDGTPIVVWDRYLQEPVIAHWSYSLWGIHNSYGFNEDGEIPGEDVSHWMPLPPAPVVEERQHPTSQLLQRGSPNPPAPTSDDKQTLIEAGHHPVGEAER